MLQPWSILLGVLGISNGIQRDDATLPVSRNDSTSQAKIAAPREHNDPGGTS